MTTHVRKGWSFGEEASFEDAFFVLVFVDGPGVGQKSELSGIHPDFVRVIAGNTIPAGGNQYVMQFIRLKGIEERMIIKVVNGACRLYVMIVNENLEIACIEIIIDHIGVQCTFESNHFEF